MQAGESKEGPGQRLKEEPRYRGALRPRVWILFEDGGTTMEHLIQGGVRPVLEFKELNMTALKRMGTWEGLLLLYR